MNRDRMDRCLDPEEMGRVAQSSSDDPCLAHMRDCPRCRARLIAYREFVEQSAAAPGSDSATAAVRLRRAFDLELMGPGSREARRTATGSTKSRLRAWFNNATLRPAWALGAALMLAVVFYAGHEWRHGSGPRHLLRGPAPQSGFSAAHGRIDLLPLRALPSGGVELRWRGVPGADAYDVRIIGPDLGDLARFASVRDTVLVLLPNHVPSDAGPGAAAAWRVTALQGGRRLAESRVEPIHLP